MPTHTKESLTKLVLADLRMIAKDLGVPKSYKLNKDPLIDGILSTQATSASEDAKMANAVINLGPRMTYGDVRRACNELGLKSMRTESLPDCVVILSRRMTVAIIVITGTAAKDVRKLSPKDVNTFITHPVKEIVEALSDSSRFSHVEVGCAFALSAGEHDRNASPLFVEFVEDTDTPVLAIPSTCSAEVLVRMVFTAIYPPSEDSEEATFVQDFEESCKNMGLHVDDIGEDEGLDFQLLLVLSKGGTAGIILSTQCFDVDGDLPTREDISWEARELGRIAWPIARQTKDRRILKALLAVKDGGPYETYALASPGEDMTVEVLPVQARGGQAAARLIYDQFYPGDAARRQTLVQVKKQATESLPAEVQEEMAKMNTNAKDGNADQAVTLAQQKARFEKRYGKGSWPNVGQQRARLCAYNAALRKWAEQKYTDGGEVPCTEVTKWFKNHPDQLADTGIKVDDVSTDHVLPKSWGGPNHIFNYVLVPKNVNSHFHDKLTTEKTRYVGGAGIKCAKEFNVWARDRAISSKARVNYNEFDADRYQGGRGI